jgi:hypothetical protein
MDNHSITPNPDNDLMFREGILNEINKQKKIDQLLKQNGESLITEDSKADEQIQYFTE